MPRKRKKDEERSAAPDEGKQQAEGEQMRGKAKRKRKEVRTAADVAAERAAEVAEAAETGTPEAEQPEAAAEPEAPEPEEAAEPEAAEEKLPPVAVPDLLKSFCAMLIGQGWQKLGLVMDPSTNEIAQDLAQARLAIDSLAALVDQLAEHLTDEEKRELDAALANLRLNYVQRAPGGQAQQGEGKDADN